MEPRRAAVIPVRSSAGSARDAQRTAVIVTRCVQGREGSTPVEPRRADNRRDRSSTGSCGGMHSAQPSSYSVGSRAGRAPLQWSRVSGSSLTDRALDLEGGTAHSRIVQRWEQGREGSTPVEPRQRMIPVRSSAGSEGTQCAQPNRPALGAGPGGLHSSGAASADDSCQIDLWTTGIDGAQAGSSGVACRIGRAPLQWSRVSGEFPADPASGPRGINCARPDRSAFAARAGFRLAGP